MISLLVHIYFLILNTNSYKPKSNKIFFNFSYIVHIYYYVILKLCIFQVVENLSFEKLTSWTDPKYMKKKYTTVFLPHFQIESAYSMKEMMSSMGMLDVFNETKATFTGISKDNLFLLDIISLATVNADEDGTKDITNTDDYFGFLALMLPEATFRVDHPFFYVIQHKPTNCYVFYGTFQKP